MNHKVITLSREFGSGGRDIGKKIADELGYDFYDKELIEAAAQ
ncbi:MAG: cytidylate kinase family protein, partial [Clostridiales bacterium]